MPERVRQAWSSLRLGTSTVTTRSTSRDDVFEEERGQVLLEGVDDSAVCVSNQQLADVARVQREGDEVCGSRVGILLAPEVGQAEGPGEAVSVEVVGHDVAVLQADEGPVEHGVCDHGDDGAGDDLVGDAGARVEVPDGELALGIERYELVAAELDGGEGGRARGGEDLLDAALAEDVDFAGAELGFVCADGEEGLDGVVREAAKPSHSQVRLSSRKAASTDKDKGNAPDLRVDAVASLLVGHE